MRRSATTSSTMTVAAASHPVDHFAELSGQIVEVADSTRSLCTEHEGGAGPQSLDRAGTVRIWMRAIRKQPSNPNTPAALGFGLSGNCGLAFGFSG